MSGGTSQNGFAQADLTGGTGGQAEENSGGGAETAAAMASNEGAGASPNSFLLQGTVGQGLTTNGAEGFGGPGGPGGQDQFGLGGLAPGAPGGPGGQRGMGGAGGRFGQGGPPGGGGGTGGGQFGQGGGPGGGGGGGFGGRGGRLARQSVNRVRFSFYDRYENSALDAEPFSITGNQFPKISHYDERTGGNLGGPLKIPHVYNGSDRTYFFINYQHETVKNPINTFSTVPTLDEREGDFCGVGVSLYNPFSNLAGTRTPLGTNGCQIPTGMLNSAAQGLLNFIPMPNVAGQTVQNYILQTTTPENTDLVNVHVLHTINAKLSLNIGYNFNSQRQNTLGNFADIAGTSSTRSQNVDVSLTHNWSTHFVETTHLNWSRNRIKVLSDNAFVNNVAGDLGIEGVATQPIDYGIPQIGFTSFSSLNDPLPSLVRNQTLRVSDSATWVHQKHTLKFGAEIRRIQLNTDSDPTPRGDFTFTGVMTSQLLANGQAEQGTGSDLADFLLGLPYNTKAQFGNPSLYFRSWGFVGYAQDDWRVNKRFTLQYGVRYEAVTPPVELYDQIANLDLNATATAVDVVTPGGAGTLQWNVSAGVDSWRLRQFGAANRNRVGSGTEAEDHRPRRVFDFLQRVLVQHARAKLSGLRAAVFGGGKLVYIGRAGFDARAGISGHGRDQRKNPECGGRRSILSKWPRADLDAGNGNVFYAGLAPRFDVHGHGGWQSGSVEGAEPRAARHESARDAEQPGKFPMRRAFTTTNPARIRFTTRCRRAWCIASRTDFRCRWRIRSGNLWITRARSAAARPSSCSRTETTRRNTGGRRSMCATRCVSSRCRSCRLASAIATEIAAGWSTCLAIGAFKISSRGRRDCPTRRCSAETHPITAREQISRCARSRWVIRMAGFAAERRSAFFNTAAFATPPAGQYGDESRGAINGPCSFSWNASVAKSFRYGPEQRHHVDVRWEVQNLANHVNLSGISTLVGSSTFGRVTSAGSMRTMDINLRYNF